MVSDEEVASQIAKAVKARRKKMIKICVRERRLSPIALALPALEASSSFDTLYLSTIIHAW